MAGGYLYRVQESLYVGIATDGYPCKVHEIILIGIGNEGHPKVEFGESGRTNVDECY